MTGLQTEFAFVLPKGYVDGDGVVHREGTMRLATARDELDPLRDPRIRDADDPMLTIIVLARVVTRLGTLSQFTPREVEGLFAADLAYLQDVYGAINFGNDDDIAAVIDDARSRASLVVTPASTVDDTIDADALAARLQAEFGDDGSDDADDGELEVAAATRSRRHRIQEVGSRAG